MVKMSAGVGAGRLYRSEGFRNTFRYTIQRLMLNLAWVGFLGVLYLFSLLVPLDGDVSIVCALILATLVHYLVERPCTTVRKRLSRVQPN